jgi:hypothetical protein
MSQRPGLNHRMDHARKFNTDILVETGSLLGDMISAIDWLPEISSNGVHCRRPSDGPDGAHTERQKLAGWQQEYNRERPRQFGRLPHLGGVQTRLRQTSTIDTIENLGL